MKDKALMIKLIEEGVPSGEIAFASGYSRSYICELRQALKGRQKHMRLRWYKIVAALLYSKKRKCDIARETNCTPSNVGQVLNKCIETGIIHQGHWRWK